MSQEIDVSIDAALGLAQEVSEMPGDLIPIPDPPQASSSHNLFDEMMRQQSATMTFQQELFKQHAAIAHAQMEASLMAMRKATDQAMEAYRRKLDAKVRAMERLGLVDLSLEVEKEG